MQRMQNSCGERHSAFGRYGSGRCGTLSFRWWFPPLYFITIKTIADVKLSILLFVTKNKDQFFFNSQVNKINTRQTSNLYLPTANLAVYQKGVCYSGIKIYIHLPTAIKELSGDKNKFKLVLKRYLLRNSCYSLEEYFNI